MINPSDELAAAILTAHQAGSDHCPLCGSTRLEAEYMHTGVDQPAERIWDFLCYDCFLAYQVTYRAISVKINHEGRTQEESHDGC